MLEIVESVKLIQTAFTIKVTFLQVCQWCFYQFCFSFYVTLIKTKKKKNLFLFILVFSVKEAFSGVSLLASTILVATTHYNSDLPSNYKPFGGDFLHTCHSDIFHFSVTVSNFACSYGRSAHNFNHFVLQSSDSHSLLQVYCYWNILI